MHIVLGLYSDFWGQKEKVYSRKVRAVREIGRKQGGMSTTKRNLRILLNVEEMTWRMSVEKKVIGCSV